MAKVKKLKGDKPVHKNQMFCITLPIAPSVNHMYYNTRGGGRRLTRVAEQYFNSQRQYAKTEVVRQGWQFEYGDVWFVLEADFYQPDRRTRDTHNMFKIIHDVLENVVYKNDYFVKPRVGIVELDVDNPRVEIRIYPENKSNICSMCKLNNKSREIST